MAKIISEIIVIKLSKLVKDNYDDDNVLSSDQIETLSESIPELIESIIADDSIIVDMTTEVLATL